jgi:hypothetical protein
MDLQGKVYNELGNLYSGTLTVTLYNDDTGATITGVTNPVTTSNGTWSFTGLNDTVKYRVEVASGNYKRIIVPGKVQHIDLQLTGNLDVNGTSNLAGNVTCGGNIVMGTGATVDGVDVSALAADAALASDLATHAANVNAHHNKVHTHTSDAEGGSLNLSAYAKGTNIRVAGGRATISTNASPGTYNTISFPTAFSSAPAVTWNVEGVGAPYEEGALIQQEAASTTGFRLYVKYDGYGAWSGTVSWIAIGPV